MAADRSNEDRAPVRTPQMRDFAEKLGEGISVLWKEKNIKSVEAWKMLGVSKNTFYRYLRIYEANLANEKSLDS